jgi:hypothetical protein
MNDINDNSVNENESEQLVSTDSDNIENSSKKRVHQRYLRNFLIYPRYQLALVGINISILAAGFVIIYYQVSNSFFNLDEVAKEKNILANPFYQELVLIQESIIINNILSTTIVCIFFASLFTILFSHRSAGAIYGLQKYFEDISENGYTRPLSFRKGDLHKDLPEAVNIALVKMNSENKKKEDKD